MIGRKYDTKMLPGILISAFLSAGICNGAEIEETSAEAGNGQIVEDSILQNVTDADFENEVVNSNGLVLVDFWAPWCGPCNRLIPVLEELAAQKGSDLKIVRINIDDNPLMKEKYDIQYIPIVVLFKDGKEIDRKVGVHQLSELLEWVSSGPAKHPVPSP